MEHSSHNSARDRNPGLWVEHNDRLYVAAYSSVASLVVTFSGYFRKMNGEIVEYAVIVNPTSDRAVTAGTQHFGAGFLLSCVATLASGNANRGQCYVRAQIQRSAGTPAIKLHGVLGGYVTDDYSPSFPYGKIEGPLEGPGCLRSVTGSNPAAGAEISETVPTGARWELIALSMTLVTAVAVANRTAVIVIDDGTTIILGNPAVVVQPASNTFDYSVQHYGAESLSNAGNVVINIPPHLRLPAGFRIITFTGNMQAADNWAAPQMMIEEWIEA